MYSNKEREAGNNSSGKKKINNNKKEDRKSIAPHPPQMEVLMENLVVLKLDVKGQLQE
jgi:hypothetical protein